MLLYYYFFLSILTSSTSGTLVSFSYDARRSNANSSPMEIISFLKENKVSPSQIRVFASDHSGLSALANSGVLVDLYLNESDVDNLRKSKASAVSWIKAHLITSLPYINITSIIISTSSSSSNLVAREQLPMFLSTLKSIRSELESFCLDRKVKVAIHFPHSVLENLVRHHSKDLIGVVDFIRESQSFIVVGTEIDGELSMGDHFVGLVIKSALSAASILRHKYVPVVLNVKSSVVPSAIEVAEFNMKMMKSLESHAHISDRVAGILAEISPMDESEQKELRWEEEQIFHSSHRQLTNKPIPDNKVTLHDSITPTPTIITVPSTNPAALTPFNPATTPITVPATNPVVATPITVPPMVPITPPSAVPIGNTVPPPTTVPMAPPATTPITNPVTPPTATTPTTGSGQTWCVAKTGVAETALQTAIDYACGIGGADCSAIQPTGNCYNPNTPQNHASYAFNSYYQKHPAPTSCDFKGVAMLVNANPSTGSCVYPSSSAGSTTPTPTPTPPSSSLSPPSVLNSSNPTPPSDPTGTSNPIGSSNPDSSTTPLFGSSPPPSISTSESSATELQPLFASIILASFLVTHF